MDLRLYELSNADGVNTSPFVWRVKFALQHKRLAYERTPVGYFGISQIGDGRFQTVPVLEHVGIQRSESWAIVEWLDKNFPERLLFSSPAELTMVRFFDKWFGTQVLPHMFRYSVLRIYERVRAEEQPYFRASRERLFDRTLEEVAADAPSRIKTMHNALLPLRLALRRDPYLGGVEPNYADYIGWSAFVAFEPVLKHDLLAADDPLHPWLERGRALAATA